MKSIKNHFNSIALILSILILFQGCTVYKSAPISLDQAVQNDTKVRVKTNSNEKLKFTKIVMENGNYYGVMKSEGQIIRIPLDHNSIDSIEEKNKPLSTILSIVIPLIIVFGGAVIAMKDCCGIIKK